MQQKAVQSLSLVFRMPDDSQHCSGRFSEIMENTEK